MLTSIEDPVGRARMLLEGRGVVATQLLPPEIGESWQRCLRAGLDPTATPAPLDLVGRPKHVREPHEKVLGVVMAEMRGLYRAIAGTHFIVAFAAPDGRLLETIGDPGFCDTGGNAAIRPGTMWTERWRGTNALGTAAQTGRAVTVHGPEHFFRAHAGLTCIAAPVYGPGARLAGILDVSSDCRTRQVHTGALVGLTASLIEAGLFRAEHRGDIVVAFHPQPGGIDTHAAGLLAFDAGGVVLGSNSHARALLDGLPALPGYRCDELFDVGWGFVLAAAGGRAVLHDRRGAAYAAAVQPAARPAVRALGSPAPARAFVAADPAVAAAVALTEAAARRGVPVLIRGPTGTGKEALARHAHAVSGRTGAFVPVNCAAIAESLAEAELFGHAPGAFTGAQRSGSPGLVVEADRGTLFLDEIGDMKPALQALLLRLLDDWAVRPVGGGKPRTVDVLLLAATNCDLRAATAAGRFRADLYWRLNVVEAVLPALADRADIAAVTDHVVAQVAPGLGLSAATRDWIARQPWPGNVRELRSVITRLALTGHEPAESGPAADQPPAGLHQATVRRIRDVVAAADGNVSAAARNLGVSRNTVYRALRRPGR